MAKILILANNDVGFYKFRKELLIELVKENEVYISLPYGDYIPQLEEIGCIFIDTSINRRGTNPFTDMRLIIKYKKIVNNIKPDVVLTYTIKPNVYGGIVCRMSKIPYLPNVTGLGTSIENGGVMQRITLKLYKEGLKKASCVFFQNDSNRKFFFENNIINNKTRLIPGSGVNLKEHKFEEYPTDDGTSRFLFIGRIMNAKGVAELLEAAKKVKTLYPNIYFDLVGFSEEVYTQELLEFEKKGIITYHGQQNNIHSFIKRSHATILPSHHEGLANVLLESASAGRPILASNIPGCIETFEDGVSGFGFEVRNVNDLSEKIIKFSKLPHFSKKEMGVKGRKKVENEFNRNIVINAYLEEINMAKKGN